MTHPTDTWIDRALRIFPGGSNGEFGIPPERLVVPERGRGARIWDTQGREFMDFTMAWGSALVGHAHPQVVEAASTAAKEGVNFASLHRRSIELGERICSVSPCAERIRFVASGTEATMLCLRVAHAATGRPKVLRFEGAYHGQHPVGVAGMIHSRPTDLPTCDAAGAGAPWTEQDVLVAPYNDLETTTRILDTHASSLAAVIVEPLHRCLVPRPGFLEGLRERTRRHGIVLIFDEVVTGFRLAPGGAQEYYGVVPDLVAYGKALGGGFPIGAFAGRADVMEVLEERRLPGPRYTWSASTTGGNPVSCAAAMATLDILLQPGVHDALHALGRRFRAGMESVVRSAGESARILGDGPLGQVAFSATPVTDQASWLASDRTRGGRLMLELLSRGVFLNPMGTKLYLSLEHSETELAGFLEAFAEALPASRNAR
jgi:glutamate-1-semialdehyde 2,1-aminomutase